MASLLSHGSILRKFLAGQVRRLTVQEFSWKTPPWYSLRRLSVACDA